MLARIESGPATLAMLVGVAVSEYKWAQAVDTLRGVMSALQFLAARGVVACAKARIGRKRKHNTLVWLLADKKDEHVRREAARLKRELEKKPPERPQLVIAGTQPIGTTHTDEPMGPMEILARLAGGSTYVDPDRVGGARGGLTNAEIDFVLAGVDDDLGKHVAFSIACKDARDWPHVNRLGYPRVLENMDMVPSLRDLAFSDRRARLRMVLHHVYHDLAGHRRRGGKVEGAKACGMRVETFLRAYRFIESELIGAADDAAAQAIDTLFNRWWQ